MNKQFRLLALDAGYPDYMTYGQDKVLERFAELIVRECVKVAMRSVSDDEPKEAWYLIQEHFGVER